MRKLMLLAALVAGTASATHPTPQPPKVVTVERHDHDGALAGALVGAGIAWWIMHRRAKRSAPPVVAAPPCDCPATTCPEPSEREQRIFETCVAK